MRGPAWWRRWRRRRRAAVADRTAVQVRDAGQERLAVWDTRTRCGRF